MSVTTEHDLAEICARKGYRIQYQDAPQRRQKSDGPLSRQGGNARPEPPQDAGNGTKKGKYRNVKTRVGDIVFDSKREAARYFELLILTREGEIKDLVLQPTLECWVKDLKVCNYKADFSYMENQFGKWVSVTEDCKGMKTPVYKLKKKLVRAIYGIEIRET